MIESAEVSGNVSSRDGLLMKRLPEGSRFGHQGLMQYLQVRESRKHRAIHLLTHRGTCQDAIVGNEALVRLPMSAHFGSALAPTHGTRGRHVLYALRSMALIKAMKPALALKASFLWSCGWRCVAHPQTSADCSAHRRTRVPHWHSPMVTIWSLCLQHMRLQPLHWPTLNRCAVVDELKITLLSLLLQDIGAVAHVRCGAADIDVEPRTAAAMSLHQLTKLVPGNAKYADALARCIERMPAIHGRVRWRCMRPCRKHRVAAELSRWPRQVLVEESTPGLCRRIKQERDATLPEFKRSRPKYAAYFTWMSQRIEERYPGMEQCAIDKLLCMDSGELDLLLQPQNKDMDAATLLAAADKGIDWKTFQALASAETAHMAHMLEQ